MIDLSEKEFKIVLNILKKYIPEYDVVAFGSRIKNTAKKFSDLDLAIMSDNGLSKEKLLLIKESFEDSDLNICVDILDYVKISDSFKKVIDEKNVIIQKKKN